MDQPLKAPASDWWNPWDWSQHTLDVLTALGTTGAVLAVLVLALLSGTWRAYRRWRRRPVLKLAFDRSMHLNPEGIALDGDDTVSRAAYVRLAVTNEDGRAAAHGVEVLV